ncbi:hypothetical protein [Scytonema sp. NUACC21]
MLLVNAIRLCQVRSSECDRPPTLKNSTAIMLKIKQHYRGEFYPTTATNNLHEKNNKDCTLVYPRNVGKMPTD